MVMGQYWLSFQINPKHFQNVATKFEKKNYLTEFSIDD